jgi:hypothetical protein
LLCKWCIYGTIMGSRLSSGFIMRLGQQGSAQQTNPTTLPSVTGLGNEPRFLSPFCFP